MPPPVVDSGYLVPAWNLAKSTPTAVSIGATAVGQVLAANPRRVSATIANNSGTITLFIGSDATVTTGNGMPIPPGGTFTDDASTDAWYGVAASAVDVRVIETSLPA